MNVHQATIADIEKITPLFDLYRQFYGQPSDICLAHTFLSERITHNQSMVLVVSTEAGYAIGFAQLYPSFSSVSAAPILILNDLFVHPSARKTGAGTALLDAAKNYAQSVGAVRLFLSTALTNQPAQNLYEQNGWVRDEAYCTYELLFHSNDLG